MMNGTLLRMHAVARSHVLCTMSFAAFTFAWLESEKPGKPLMRSALRSGGACLKLSLRLEDHHDEHGGTNHTPEAETTVDQGLQFVENVIAEDVIVWVGLDIKTYNPDLTPPGRPKMLLDGTG